VKIKDVSITEFKRFTNLSIKNLPETAKLVVLVGTNGCGKSSLFDGFKVWHNYHGYNNGSDNSYCNKNQKDSTNAFNKVSLSFYNMGNDVSVNNSNYRQSFYFRTAYRNEPDFRTSGITTVQSPLEKNDNKFMIHNDVTVSVNYQRLVANTVRSVYNQEKDDMMVSELREELIGKIRLSMLNIFDDLVLSEIGDPLSTGTFYFDKGVSKNFAYKNLSGGEKAAFDIILDLIIKAPYYQDSIYCIDEPETHMHTRLQSSLLAELYKLIPDKCQLWIATHSLGMMRKAKELNDQNTGTVVFLDFDNKNFDETVLLEPASVDKSLWNKFMSIAIDEYAGYITPKKVIFCEGTTKGRKNKDFDSRCFTTIFEKEYPEVFFYSLGSCNEVTDDKNAVINATRSFAPHSEICRVIDRDERSKQEIDDLQSDGVQVLSRRHIECYLLDDEIIKKLCEKYGHFELFEEAKKLKYNALQSSINRGNPTDDIKSAAGDIYNDLRKLLVLKCCGNNHESFLRDTMAPLVTSETAVYVELKKDIFNE
jgi:predicted ATPase